MAKKKVTMTKEGLLNQIIAGTAKDGSINVSEEFEALVATLESEGLIEIDPRGYIDGNIAVRSLPPTSTPVKEERMSLVIENIPVTKPARGRSLKPREKKYPELSNLEVGQSVFIAGLDIKQGRAVASSAKRDFREEAGEKTRKTGKVVKSYAYSRDFVANAVDGGVRVGRVS